MLSDLGGVLLIGGSGFIGTRIAARLLISGKKNFVRVVDVKAPPLELGGIDYYRHDVRDPIPLEVGKGVSVIYNLAAVHRTPGHPAHEYYETNVNGALNCTGLAEACGIRRIAFTSSISIYGPTEETLTEESTPAPSSDYGRSKRIAEAIHCRWLEGRQDRRLVIVRPGVIFGPGENGNYTSLGKALRRGYFFYPGRSDTVKSGAHVDELVRSLEFALERDERYVLFNLAYPDMSTISEIVQAFTETAGYSARCATVPLPLLLAAAKPFEILNRLGFDTRIHSERVMKLVSSTKIYPGWLQSNGYRFETDLAGGLCKWRDESQGSFV